MGSVGSGRLAVSPDGRSVAVPTLEGFIYLFDAAKMKSRKTLFGREAMGVLFLPDGKRLAASGGSPESVKVWDIESGQVLLTLSGRGALLFRIALVENGNSLLVGSKGQSAVWQIWRAPSWDEITRTEKNGGGWERSRLPQTAEGYVTD